MEDSHTHILSLPDDPDAAFFAVYDGHGGSNVAEYAGKHLHKYIVKQPSYKTNIAEALKQVSIEILRRSVKFFFLVFFQVLQTFYINLMFSDLPRSR